MSKFSNAPDAMLRHGVAYSVLTGNPIGAGKGIYETDLEGDMLAIGYVRSPNNVDGLASAHHRGPLAGISPIWYPGTAGLPCPKPGLRVQVAEDRIRVYSVKLFGEAYTKRTWTDTTTIAVFESVADFVAYCKAEGGISEPGNGANVFD